MYDPLRLARTLEESSDPHNPGPEELASMLLECHVIAVVGMSRHPTKAARRVPSYLAAHGYELIPVNPHADRILGKRARPALSTVEQPVDLVLLFRPSAEVQPFVRDAAARQERPAIWLQEGIVGGQAVDEARAAGLMVIQDLCVYKVHRALHHGVRRSAPTDLADEDV